MEATWNALFRQRNKKNPYITTVAHIRFNNMFHLSTWREKLPLVREFQMCILKNVSAYG